jgi:hypothetical protein
MEESNSIHASEETIVSLLDDTDSRGSVVAMQLLLSHPDSEAIVLRLQDSENPRIRRRIHQVSNVLRQRRLCSHLTKMMSSYVIDSFWDILRELTIVYDYRFTQATLDEMLDGFFERLNLGSPRSSDLLRAVKKLDLKVPRSSQSFEFPMFFLSEVVDSSLGHELVFCALLNEAYKRKGWSSAVTIYEGKFMLQLPDKNVVSPADDWAVMKKIDSSRFHLCLEIEMFRTYMALIHSASVIDCQPFDLCIFTKIMTDSMGYALRDMPYPLGDWQYVSRDAKKGSKK